MYKLFSLNWTVHCMKNPEERSAGAEASSSFIRVFGTTKVMP
jgi:hypothetical protein